MQKKIVTWCKGYILVRINGDYKERFLNLCKVRGINIWKLHCKCEVFEFCILARDYIKLKGIRRKTKILPVILKKYGMPFIINKLKNRQALVVGIMISIFIIYVCSLFVWDISIYGESKHTKEALIVYLNSKNIKLGSKVSDIDCRKLEEDIRKKYNDISWVSARISGTRLIINLKENKIFTQLGKDKETRSLIAENDGIVKKIIVRKGTPMVKKNDRVKKGNVLVSGNIKLTNDNDELIKVEKCKADADVYIEENVKYSDKFSKKNIIKKYIEKNNNSVEFFFKNIKIFINIPFKKNDNCDIINSVYKVKISGDLYTPFVISSKEYKYYRKYKVELSKKEVGNLVDKRYRRFCEQLEQKGTKIMKSNVTYLVDKEYVIVSGFVRVIQKAVKYVPVEDAKDNLNEGF